MSIRGRVSAYLITLASLIGGSLPAFAQCSGVFPSGSLCANAGAASALGTIATPTTWLNRWAGSGANTMLYTNGTSWQALSAANLIAIAGVTSAADKIPYFTGAGTAAVADFNAQGRALVALSATTGFPAITGAGTAASRTLAAPAAGLTITNPAGVAGNPTFAFANDLAALEALSGTGIARRTGTDAWSVGTTVAVGEGGTGVTSGTSGGVPYFSSSSTIASTGTLAAGGVVYGGGAGIAPATTNVGTNGQFLAGSTGIQPSFVTLSQDCTITNAGVITCLKTNNVSFGTAAVQNTGTSGPNLPFLNAGNTWSGTQSFATTVDAQQAFKRSGDISPIALSGDVNDYAPTGFSTASVIRQDGGAANRNVTGLAGGTDGGDVILLNVGATNNLVLKNESASSTTTNRFAIGGDVTLAPSQSATLWYDSTSSRWRISANYTVAGGSPSGTVTSTVCGTVTITTSGTCDNGVLLETLTASNSPSLTTGATLSSYNRILLVFEQYLPATDDSGCRIRVNVGGVQATNYSTYIYVDGLNSSSVTTYMPCSFIGAGVGLSNDVNDGGMFAEVWLSRASSTTGKKIFRGNGGYIDSAGAFTNPMMGGAYTGGNGAITALEISQSSGNITSGTVKVYGFN